MEEVYTIRFLCLLLFLVSVALILSHITTEAVELKTTEDSEFVSFTLEEYEYIKGMCDNTRRIAYYNGCVDGLYTDKCDVMLNKKEDDYNGKYI